MVALNGWGGGCDFDVVWGRRDSMWAGWVLGGVVGNGSWIVDSPKMVLTRYQFVLSLEPGVTRMDMDGLACERRVSRVESEFMGGVSVGHVWDGRRE